MGEKREHSTDLQVGTFTRSALSARANAEQIGRKPPAILSAG
jgi:hypothetical protein